MKKQTNIVILLALFLGASAYLWSSFNAFADSRTRSTDSYQREEEDDEDKDNYVAPSPQPIVPVQEAVVTTTASAPVQVVQSVPKTTYMTVTDPPTYVTEMQTQTVKKKDSDKDALIDEIDPNPTIPEYYITQDEDSNGIIDIFEYAAQ